jgi:hypothetical protein
MYGETRWNALQRLKRAALLSKMRSTFGEGMWSEGDVKAMTVDTVDREENGCCVYTSSVPHKADLYRNWNYDMQSRFSNVRTTGYHDKILQKAASAEGAKGGNCLAGACEMTEKELLDVLASDRLERVRGPTRHQCPNLQRVQLILPFYTLSCLLFLPLTISRLGRTL